MMPSPRTLAINSSLSPSLSLPASSHSSHGHGHGPNAAVVPRNAHGLYADRKHHIVSAIAAAAPPPTAAAPSRLPRTSSLLPPPIALDAAPTSNAALSSSAAVAERLNGRNPDRSPGAARRRPSISHSRSHSHSDGPSSASANLNVNASAADGFKNLNRWSASSTSSRNSAQNGGPSSSGQPGRGVFARRLSVDATALAAAQSQYQVVSNGSSGNATSEQQQQQQQQQPQLQQPQQQTPRKLQKTRRPSTSGQSHRRTLSNESRLSEPKQSEPLFALIDLPPIVPLPALEFDGSPLLPSDLLGNADSGPQSASDGRGQAGSSSRAEESSWAAGNSVEAPPSPRSSRTMVPSRPAMVYERNGETYAAKGHSRNRSQATKGSTDTTSSRGKERSTKPPSQKAMLSRALQKANMAVQLDNAQNLEGAREAYAEACDLLQQVLNRTPGDDDKRKLEAIRRTYTSRIEELDIMVPARTQETKALPARPESNGNKPGLNIRDEDDDDIDDYAVIETATVTRIGGRSPVQGPAGYRQNGGAVDADSAGRPGLSVNAADQRPLQSSFSRSPAREPRGDGLVLRPNNDPYLPPPLSPRRPPSPGKAKGGDTGLVSGPSADARDPTHARGASHESVSWLDPIDESGASSPSSVHSRSSSLGVRRKHIRHASGTTEAEFDTALDEAIEAAYDDGYEPMDDDEMMQQYEDGDRVVANALRKVEIAKERVRQTERETIELEAERERRRQLQQEQDAEYEPPDFYEGDSSDEGERIFAEMSKGYSIDDFSLKSRGKPSAGRESDSSAMTSRTWMTSSGSNPPTATTLSTVAETPVSAHSKSSSGLPPPPDQALPELPPQAGQNGGSQQANASAQSVRNRRLSGQNPKQLKIETSGLSQERQARSAVSTRERRDRPQPPLPESPARQYPPSPPLTYPAEEDGAESPLRSESPSAYMPMLRTTYSETSLRSYGARNMSTSNLDDASELSPGTPLSGNHFSNGGALGGMPNLPTPLAASYREKLSGDSGGGLFLFDDNIHSPYSPGSPNPLMADAPVSLEPCPNDFLLRPFWLMRCLYQTLAHPRGGYLSNKLFVPRDVWRVKGVRIKNLEEKVANCDYLTAALLKLAQVDTCDADAVLEEMQSLDSILDKAQVNLTRKLGAEVGVPSSSALFKDSAGIAEDDAAQAPRSGSVSGKSSASSFSWRRLRTKNSAVGLGSAYGGGKDLDGAKESLSLATLPMTSHPTSRPSKRDVSQAQFAGPNKEYMDSLARLFDAAQALDEIARQVEDPGLRASDKTQVGLELCARHAAEFFSFYILRFVLADLAILLEKFIKRGSEWVAM